MTRPRKGAYGTITAGPLKEVIGTPIRVLNKLWFPDRLVVEVLKDNSIWKKGTIGDIPDAYFTPTPQRPRKRKL